jgi:hypothetical protein
MNTLFRRYKWKWLILLVPSWLLAVAMPSAMKGMNTTIRIFIAIWVTTLCLALPVAEDYWKKQFERFLDWGFSLLSKGRTKERAMVYGMWFALLSMILWFVVVFLLIASPVGQILFFLGILFALFFPITFLFIQTARGGQHA